MGDQSQGSGEEHSFLVVAHTEVRFEGDSVKQ